jgi:hypothetical protein
LGLPSRKAAPGGRERPGLMARVSRVTWCPWAVNALVKEVPTNPVPPVMKIFIASIVKYFKEKNKTILSFDRLTYYNHNSHKK